MMYPSVDDYQSNKLDSAQRSDLFNTLLLQRYFTMTIADMVVTIKIIDLVLYNDLQYFVYEYEQSSELTIQTGLAPFNKEHIYFLQNNKVPSYYKTKIDLQRLNSFLDSIGYNNINEFVQHVNKAVEEKLQNNLYKD